MKNIAEALVECGYAHSVPTSFNFIPQEGVEYIQMVKKPDLFQYGQYQEVNPFADTLEGRKQANALEDWLFINHNRLWAIDSKRPEAVPPIISSSRFYSQRQWRLDRIKWCFEQPTIIEVLK